MQVHFVQNSPESTPLIPLFVRSGCVSIGPPIFYDQYDSISPSSYGNSQGSYLDSDDVDFQSVVLPAKSHELIVLVHRCVSIPMLGMVRFARPLNHEFLHIFKCTVFIIQFSPRFFWIDITIWICLWMALRQVMSIIQQ